MESCLVIAFGAYTIRLLSHAVKQLFELVPVELEGWETPVDKLSLQDITMSSLLERIDVVRQSHGFERTAVLGYSFGGMIALDYALRFPDRVSKVIALCSPPCWNSSFKAHRTLFQEKDLSEERVAILKQNQAAFDTALSTIPPEERFSRYTAVQAPLYWYDPRYDESPYWEGLKVNLDLVNHIDSIVYAEHDQTSLFPTIGVPVFAAFGRYDYAMPYDSWDPYTGLFKNLTTHVFQRSSHHPMVEEADAFDRKLSLWVKESEGTDGRRNKE